MIRFQCAMSNCDSGKGEPFTYSAVDFEEGQRVLTGHFAIDHLSDRVAIPVDVVVRMGAI